MKVLKTVFNKEDSLKNSKSTKIKLHLRKPGKYEDINIDGVPAIQSDNSDCEEQTHQILHQLKNNIDSFKIRKAQEVAAQYLKSKKSIKMIISEMKEQIMEQMNQILSGQAGKKCDHIIKSPKELGSTVANSEDKYKSADTPSFELMRNTKEIHQFSIDLREFTLGQKDKSSSGSSKNQKDYHNQSEVSQFSVGNMPKQSSSKRIKDRIMNSGKNKAK